MISVETILAKVTELRQTLASESLASPLLDHGPSYGYGFAAGRDAAFAIILQSIEESLNEERERERKLEEGR